MKSPFITGSTIGRIQPIEWSGDLTIEAIFASNARDMQGDVCDEKFLKQMTNDLNKGVSVYQNHFIHTKPLGKVLKAAYYDDGDSKYVKGTILIDINDPEMKRMIADRRLPYVSIGGHLTDSYMQKAANGKGETRVCTDGQIMEVSLTSVPINTTATVILAKGQKYDCLEFYKSVLFADPAELAELYPNGEIEFEESSVAKGLSFNQGTEMSSDPFHGNGVQDGVKSFTGDAMLKTENLDSKWTPNVSGFQNDTTELGNSVSEISQKQFVKEKSETNSISDDSDGFPKVDEHTGKQFNKHSAKAVSDPNPYDDGNSANESTQKFFNKTKTDVAKLSKALQGELVDAILHDFKTKDLSQADGESDVEALHRLMEQKNRYYRKGSMLYNGIQDEIKFILKSINWEELSNNPYDRLIAEHISGPQHLEELSNYIKAIEPSAVSMYGGGYGDGSEEESAEEESAPVETAPPAAPAEAVPPTEAPAEPQADAMSPEESQLMEALQNDPQFQQMVDQLLQQQPELEQNPEMLMQALMQLFAEYQGGGAQQPEAPMGFGDGDYAKAAKYYFNNARKESITKSRVITETAKKSTSEAVNDYFRRYSN